MFGQVEPAVTLTQPAGESAKIAATSGSGNVSGDVKRMVTNLVSVPTYKLEAEATQVVFPYLLFDHA